jgi:hypothetical protein
MRQPDIKYRVLIQNDGEKGITRSDTIFAQNIGAARFQAMVYILRNGERIYDIYIDRR